MQTVLVTGGAGYIGSHMVYALCDRGAHVIVLDNLSTGVRGLVCEEAVFVLGDVGDRALVTSLLRDHDVSAVVHFAGSVVVPESVSHPLRYYDNNVAATRTLIQSCIDAQVTNFLFSSTAAVYGTPDCATVNEDSPKDPINPYGRSKLMVEWMLRDAADAYNFRYIALRYFNVAGADPIGRTGQSTPNATHLIKRAAQVALGRSAVLDIFGTDFPTPDGTGVRDYIHVSDLVEAHILALEALSSGIHSDAFNCGYGRGLSVREIVSAIERITNRPLTIREAPRRPGDCAMLIADPSKLKKKFGWQPQHADIDVIVRSALDWERRFNA